MAKRIKQLAFIGKEFEKPKDSFGGSLLKNSHAKIKRPLENKFAILVTMRATASVLRLPKNFKNVNGLIYGVAKKHGVSIYEYANVGNHIHLLIKIPHVYRWAAFIRELTGRIAQVVQGLKGRQAGLPKFWKQRPHTRIVRGWRKVFRIAKEYVHLNFLEGEGFIKRKETKTLADLRALIVDW